MTSAMIIALIYAVMSLVTAVVYWRDKRAAQRGRPRIRERTLHLLELLGGWPGALFAQYSLRHKCVKWSYQLVFWMIVALHISGWALAITKG